VANTRFADPNGKIFRISKAITVPAKGTLVVTLTADQAGASYNIGPSTFSIPGLSAANKNWFMQNPRKVLPKDFRAKPNT